MEERIQYKVFIGLSIIAISLTAILYIANDLLFHRFIGNINPLVAVVFIMGLGFLLLVFLISKGGFAIYKKGKPKSLLYFSGLALLFLPASILVDVKVGFPADINILLPESLLFYPVIGFFVEIIFHVLPLSLLLYFLSSTLKIMNHEKIIWVCVVVVSQLEPFYQTTFMTDSNYYPVWSMVLVWINLFLFNVTQLIIFKRSDFISMYSFRLVYYFFWHIVWGYFRLEWLF